MVGLRLAPTTARLTAHTRSERCPRSLRYLFGRPRADFQPDVVSFGGQAMEPAIRLPYRFVRFRG
jgi:hypothetical protein